VIVTKKGMTERFSLLNGARVFEEAEDRDDEVVELRV
jgi:hypothetical protein